MAPEVIESTHYSVKIDVYSFGILMYQVVTDMDPYSQLTKNKMTPFKFNNKVVNENYCPTFSVPVKKTINNQVFGCIDNILRCRKSFTYHCKLQNLYKI